MNIRKLLSTAAVVLAIAGASLGWASSAIPRGENPPAAQLPQASEYFPDVALTPSDAKTTATAGEATTVKPTLLADTKEGVKIYGLVKASNSYSIASVEFGPEERSSTLKTLDGAPYEYTTGIYYDGTYNVFYSFMNLVFGCNRLAPKQGWNSLGDMSVSEDFHIIALTYDAITHTIYGVFTDDSGKGCSLGTIEMDIYKASKTIVATLDKLYVSISADASGKLYAIDETGTLCTLDTHSGEASVIGQTGLTPALDTSHETCIDPETGKLYWMCGNSLYLVDTTSGSTAKVGDTSGTGNWSGIFIMPESQIKPSWVSDFSANFSDDSLSGTIKFFMPETDMDGEPITSDMSWYVFVDETEYSGNAAPAEQVNLPLTLEEGLHVIKASARLDNVNGMEVTLNRFVGHDTPATPAWVEVKENNYDNVSVTWAEVTSATHADTHGYIDTQNIKYTLTREPGNVVIAENISGTSYTDTSIDAMGYYTYNVTANDGVKTSLQANSESTLIGAGLGFKLPYEYTDFDKGMGLFTFKDANSDGYTWAYSENPPLVWCIVNPSVDSDDWLFSPPLKFEKDMIYNLQMELSASNLLETEQIEIWYGTSPDPASMKTAIVPLWQFFGNSAVNTDFESTESGVRYIGLHVTTKAVSGAMMIDRFYVSGGILGLTPAKPTDFTATPADFGDMSAELTIVAPTRTYNNQGLESIDKIIVSNVTTGKTIREFTNPAPGAHLSVTDNDPVAGNNKYTAVCYNSYGAGLEAETECWVGLDIPGTPTDVVWMQDEEGIVTITWKAPTTGQHKGYIDPSHLQYVVAMPETSTSTRQILIDNLTYTEMQVKPEITDQQLLSFQVAAANTQGTGEAGISNEAPYGTPYTAPFYESFEGDNLYSDPWMIKYLSGYNPIFVATNIQGLTTTAFDNEGMAVYFPLIAGVTRMSLPLIDISTLDNPVLKLWCYFFDNKTTLTVKGSYTSGVSWIDAGTITDTGKEGWHLVTVSLDKFKGEKKLLLAIEASTAEQARYVLMDKLSVEDIMPCDLMISDMFVPSKIQAGHSYDASVTVTNNGSETTSEYSVEIFHDDELVTTVTGKPIEADGAEVINFSAPLSSNSTNVQVKAKVICENDADMSNNSATVIPKVLISHMPSPTGLINTSTDASRISLEWTEPKLSYNANITDDLESYESGSVGGIDVTMNSAGEIVARQTEGYIGDYKVIDNDKQLSTQVAGMIASGLPHSGEGMACQVINLDVHRPVSGSTIWAAHSGSTMFCFWQSCIGDDYDQPNDDYLILPKLADDDKHISFWAKSLTSKYGLETFQIMVSFDGNNLEDFEPFVAVVDVPAGYVSTPEAGYTFYEFDLPEDTRYAAIRYNASGTVALLVDDISYAPADNEVDLNLSGYNIYRNGRRINESLVTDTNFEDAPAETGAYRYNVTAQFEDSESRYSNTVYVDNYVSAVEDITTGNKGLIYTGPSEIIVDGLEGSDVDVYTADGRLVARTKAKAFTRISVAPGFYVVRAGSVAQSVIVK